LVLRGRLDTDLKTPKTPAAVGRGVPAAGVAAAGRRVPQAGVAAAFPRVRLAGLLAVGTLAAGVGLLVFADPAWAHGIGTISLLACAVTVFALATGPDEKPDALHGRQAA